MSQESITPPEEISVLNSFPVFEKDQVLTKDHLNSLTAYLEQQDRLSRTHLLGSGIICGLEVEYNGSNTIQILKGTALTSKGYILIQSGSVSFTKYKAYTDKTGYEKFLNDADEQIDLWELTTETDGTALSNAFLSDKCLVMYHESLDINIKECTEKDCDEQGRIRQYNIKYILILRADIEKIISSCYGNQLLTRPQLSERINAKYFLPEINLKRFGADDSALVTKSDIIAEYDKIIKSNIAILTTTLPDLFKFVKYVCPSITENITNVGAKLNTLFTAIAGSKEHYQYFYDFLYDLKLASDELCFKAMLYMDYICCSTDCFPHHIMLADPTNMFTCPRSIYRHKFYPANGNVIVNYKRELKSLFSRIKIMLSGFSKNTGGDGIIITPSKDSNRALSERAIPFYYNLPGTLLNEWNFYLSHYCRKDYNLSYNSSKYQTSTTPGFKKNPLDYEIEYFDFFRIEGHLNKDVSTVLQDIEEIRNSKRLPFEVIALKLGENSDDIEVDNTCRFNDIELMYAAYRAELICTLDKLKKFFTGIKLSHTSGSEGTMGKLGVIFGKQYSSMTQGAIVGKTLSKSSPLTNENVAAGNIAVMNTLSMDKLFLSMEKNPTQNVEALISRSLQEAGIQKFVTNDYVQLYVRYPLVLNTSLNSLIASVPEDFSDFDFETFHKASAALNDVVADYRTQLVQHARENKLDVSELTYIIEKLFYDCGQEKFKLIASIYESRSKELQKHFLFSNYIVNNPCIEHKAGVPKGGTFILVYVETKTTTGKFTGGMKGKFSDKQMKQLEKIIRGQTTRKTVVADFFVPYICCSDCPPVQYVFQEAPLVFDITPKEFCSDAADAPFTVSQTGGEITPGEYVRKTGSVYFFMPSAVFSAADTEIKKDIIFTYASPDGKTASTNVTVYRMPEAAFDEESTDVTGESFYMSCKNNSKYASSYLWESSEAKEITLIDTDATFEFPLEDDVYEATITLTATNVKCTDIEKKPFTIPAKQIVTLVSKDNELCSQTNDLKNPNYDYYFTTNPPGGIVRVEGDTQSILINESEKNGFHPDKVNFGNQVKKTLKFIYTVNNVDSQPVQITVYQKPKDQDFIVKGSLNKNKNAVTINLTTENKSGLVYKYEALDKDQKVINSFDDSTSSKEFDTVTFQNLIKNLAWIRLLISNGPCVTAVYKDREAIQKMTGRIDNQ